jgi:hypothetical protein
LDGVGLVNVGAYSETVKQASYETYADEVTMARALEGRRELY